ncbi:HNH endonuclease [Streptomyces liliifuscus]|uniref:HNH endonuclease n=1 Tax=Streptomyces liliifuscus TaxID=2797636 RepID=A0A7T7L2B1_9ACTN|nr:HNH endonuclease [Streptomyces liliifuscus]QQM45127.1 HNH endonuclease [Streptomyces liliifuscus]
MDDHLAWQVRVYGRGAGGGVRRRAPQVATRERIRAAQLGRCLYCELPIGTRVKRSGKAEALTAQWDHFVPYSYLAQNPEANWVLACQICNRIKNDRIFRTVEEAREVILKARISKGYEPIAETVAKLKPRKARRPKAVAKSSRKPKVRPAVRRVPAPRTPVARMVPKGAVSHGCGAWWTGYRRAHCPGCCQTFATERVAQLHRVGDGGERHCLPPEVAGLVPVAHPWGTCWEKPKRSVPA